MMTFVLRKDDDYIKLGQLLKAAGLVDSGSEAKDVIISGNVKCNGVVVTERGKKIRNGDIVEFRNNTVLVKDED